MRRLPIFGKPWFRRIVEPRDFCLGSEAFPDGVETFVQLFEPPLTRRIIIDHFNALQEFISTRAANYSDLDKVQNHIMANVPRPLAAQGILLAGY